MPDPRPKPPAGSITATFPDFIEPALATSIGKVPNGERWVHVIKFDGYRVQVHLRDAAARPRCEEPSLSPYCLEQSPQLTYDPKFLMILSRCCAWSRHGTRRGPSRLLFCLGF